MPWVFWCGLSVVFAFCSYFTLFSVAYVLYHCIITNSSPQLHLLIAVDMMWMCTISYVKSKRWHVFSGRTCWTFANWPAIVSDSRQKLCDDDWHFFSLCGIIGVFSLPCSLCVKRRSCGRRRKPSTRRSERRRELPKSSSWAKPLRRQSRPWLTAVHWTMTATGSCECHRTNMPPLT